MANSNSDLHCSIATYNLHGLNNGRSGLIDLCNNPQINIIAIQEHWLCNVNLLALNNIHSDFAGLGISSMNERLGKEVYRGRPYGGVGFLWRKSLSSRINIGAKAESGRGLALTIDLDSGEKIDVITVYFPCYSSSISYGADIADCLSFVEDVLGNGRPAILLGDMNFECDVNNEGYRQCNTVLSEYDIYNCDEFVNNGNYCVTYCNNSLNQSSFIDHFFVSSTIKQDIISAELHDTGVNLSDHIPLVYTFRWALSPQLLKMDTCVARKHYSWRWDKSDLAHYYECTRNALCNVPVPDVCDCVIGCHNVSHLDAINQYYENIVAALHSAASSAIKRIPCSSLKPYWNEELDRLKDSSIFWHNLWIDAGRPSSGALEHIRLSCKAKYKLALRNAYTSFEDTLSDELYLHFTEKNVPEFWKTWNAKFRKNVTRHVNINGCTGDADIANEFAKHFSDVYCEFDTDTTAYDDYIQERDNCNLNNINIQSSYDCIDGISVELIEKCLSKIKKGKACGPDDLCSEHLHYAHPALLMHLKSLFKLIMLHGFVPNSFGIGISVPLIKDKTGNINNVDNYRAITLSAVISKLFETVLLDLCGNALETDSLQFGFKSNVGCADAIFTLKSTLEYFVNRGSSVYIASLDISKAFDRVNHFKLYKSLLTAGVPVIIVDVLCNWYSKLSFAVKWNNKLSVQLTVGSGVRQGSCLSPAVFNAFMNIFITKLKLQGIGCHISTMFIGCLLYADDVILISPSVAGLQAMLDKCSEISRLLSLSFNVSKCHCLVIGKMFNVDIAPMTLCGKPVEWCNCIKYLGVYLTCSKIVKFDINPCKRAFYAACNSIFMHGSGVDELALLALQESYSLSILMYAAPALSLSNRQIDELNVCWNSVIRKLFEYHRWESVKAVILGLGRLNIKHLIMKRKIKFYKHLYFSHDNLLLNVFRVYLQNNITDSMLESVFLPTNVAMDLVYSSFTEYVNV